MITKENKSEIVKKFSRQPGDTGSAPVQVAVLTERIKQLSSHLKSHRKDYSSQRGLLQLVGQRRRILGYLKKTDFKSYGQILKQLDLRK
ncbi:MAG: 30S ribosomal protein S15 [Elusimicrobia bacterium]|nr:30S ribosomal protein S15 [Elusimicrobiota bacterium]